MAGDKIACPTVNMDVMLVRMRPRPPLDQFVECLWRMDAGPSPHARERALPTGTVELVFDLRAGEPVICGPQSSYFELDTSAAVSVLGVHFKAGGAAAFLGAPAGEFADRQMSLRDVWGSRANGLRDRLVDSSSESARFAMVEEALLSRMRRPLLPHPAVAYAVLQLTSEPSLARIGDLRADAGYSPKRFIELFRDSVGLTPKLFSRIRRFQAVLGQLTRGQQVEWAGVAADGGFYDQSHLNREFRAFAGVTPGEYQPVAPDRPSHVAVAE
jgi:AraC-like DNA-binding protein